jgi:hypothetical protein
MKNTETPMTAANDTAVKVQRIFHVMQSRPSAWVRISAGCSVQSTREGDGRRATGDGRRATGPAA